ncbi:MAG: alpha-ketoglutarate-dependent dioxygenase AlkB [Gammaproteobacteria bacterium]|nr:alpha-ketoglutarate-dependent dioxygenase AlkB [Gammaproteobacteria bacterium]MCY4218694.1 alpha-ketoglutarate-dependent dioxygenase AlkB [Gammaproteobacteria bacterium]MCY4275214.1 alpha-ketoglutarate-dependent dioxygenase AlkB [Gammaproteobacteria bacterium]
MTERLIVISNECVLFRRFFESGQTTNIYETLNSQIAWKQHTVRVFNQEHLTPRLTAWYGDKDSQYRYSGCTHTPLRWIPILTDIRTQIEQVLSQSFNSVLLNLYRNGDDTMGRHSDDEKELGPEPVIASASFGGTRRMVFHPRYGNPEKSFSVNLEDGSLFIMQGACQRKWKHSIPRTRRFVEPRINLTFRKILKSI